MKSYIMYSATIQMKATEQDFPVTHAYCTAQGCFNCNAEDVILEFDHSNESCFLEDCFLVLLVIMLHKLVLYFW